MSQSQENDNRKWIIVKSEDGLADHTQIIYKDTGKPLEGVKLIRLECEPGGLWQAVVVFRDVQLEIQAEELPVGYCPICQGECQYYTQFGTPILPPGDITEEQMKRFMAHLLYLGK